ncbi:MAG: UbiA family prenyltransferase [Candidatus Bathyarchaeota archaeon]|nr:MAG: UbiA family prenyltransferase [Candidatus Bathyarchaeota archaeon]
MHIQVLARLTRIKAYLLTLFSIIALIFLISPQNLFSSRTVIVFLANLFLTAFVYAFNDVEDAVDDYHILEKRKRNPIANGDLTKTQGYLISFLLLLIGLFLLLIIGPLVFFFGLALALIGFFYSWKPVRFKSMPFVDLIAHVICLGVLQFFITYLTFRSFDLFLIPFLMIIIPFSLMIEIFFELRDFNVDKKTNIRNTIQRFGRSNIKKLLITSGAITIAGLTIIFFTIPSEYKVVLFLGSIFLAILTVSKVNKLLESYCPQT